MRAQWGATSFMHNAHKVAKLRTNTLITGFTIMRASGNELFRFFFQTLSRSSARASILVSKGKPSFVRMEFEGAMVGCAQANVCTAASGMGVFALCLFKASGLAYEKKTFYINRKIEKRRKTTQIRTRKQSYKTNTHTHTHKQTRFSRRRYVALRRVLL